MSPQADSSVSIPLLPLQNYPVDDLVMRVLLIKGDREVIGKDGSFLYFREFRTLLFRTLTPVGL